MTIEIDAGLTPKSTGNALLAKQSVTAHAESPAEFTAFVKAERERIARVGRQAGITLD